jgi:hypothetical protein
MSGETAGIALDLGFVSPLRSQPVISPVEVRCDRQERSKGIHFVDLVLGNYIEPALLIDKSEICSVCFSIVAIRRKEHEQVLEGYKGIAYRNFAPIGENASILTEEYVSVIHIVMNYRLWDE